MILAWTLEVAARTEPTSKIAQIAYCIHRTFMLSYYNRGSWSRENARMGNHE